MVLPICGKMWYNQLKLMKDVGNCTMINISKSGFMINYWQYYLLLEKRFIDTLDYITLAEENYPCFSNEYALLIQAVGSELDSVFKTYCGYDSSQKKNIADYATYILSHYSRITTQTIRIPEYRIEIAPFKNWNGTRPKQSLVWWNAFDNIKHSRQDHRKDANQKNVLDILGALFLLERKMLQEIVVGDGTEEVKEPDHPDRKSNLFSLANTGWVTKMWVVPIDGCIRDSTECD